MTIIHDYHYHDHDHDHDHPASAALPFWPRRPLQTGLAVTARAVTVPRLAIHVPPPPFCQVLNCLGCGKIFDCRTVSNDVLRFLGASYARLRPAARRSPAAVHRADTACTVHCHSRASEPDQTHMHTPVQNTAEIRACGTPATVPTAERGGTCTYCGDAVPLTYKDRQLAAEAAAAASAAQQADGMTTQPSV